MKTVLLVGTWMHYMAAGSWMLGGRKKMLSYFFLMLPPCVVPAKEYRVRSDTFLILSKFNPHIPCELAKKILSSAAVAKLSPPEKTLCQRNTESTCVPTQSSNLFPKEPKLIHEKSPKSFLNSQKKNPFSIPCSGCLVVLGCKWIARKNTFGVVLVLVVARKNILTHRNFLHTNIYKHRFFYTEILSKQKHFWTESLPDTDIFAYEHIYTQSFFTQKLLYTETYTHTEIFAHRSFYIQKILYLNAFSQRFFSQTVLHTEAFIQAQARLHTDPFTHTPFHPHKLVNTNPFSDKDFYAQRFPHAEAWHTEVIIHSSFYTQKFLPTDAFTYRSLDTQKRLHWLQK